MMTRKDYVEVAKLLNSFLHKYSSETRPDFVDEFEISLVEPFIEMFEKDNPRFDGDRFWEACFAEKESVVK